MSASEKKSQDSKRAKRPASVRLQDALLLAEQSGLMGGKRTAVVRGRMPAALVERARAKAGARSDTELIEMALANLAVADEYADWLLAQRGTVPQDVDLEF